MELSTPHGALGTSQALGNRSPKETLSTPHGALGTTFAGSSGRTF